jgi:hypothetical protein
MHVFDSSGWLEYFNLSERVPLDNPHSWFIIITILFIKIRLF